MSLYLPLARSLGGLKMPYKKYSAKQKKLAAVAPPRKKITKADLKKVRGKKKKSKSTRRK